MKFFNPLTFIIFAIAGGIVSFVFFLIAKKICKLNPYWRGDHTHTHKYIHILT